MEITDKHRERMATMTFSSVYPHYVTKITRKGRSVDELHAVITWLTGFDTAQIQAFVEDKSTFKTFFEKAELHPNAQLIKGSICGYKIEEIDHVLTRNVRYLDKLVDELAKGKSMAKILRS